MQQKFLTAALYKFVSLPNYAALQANIHAACEACHIKGTILLASEGINGTIAGLPDDIHTLLNFLRIDSQFNGAFADLEHKESFANEQVDSCSGDDSHHEHCRECSATTRPRDGGGSGAD